MVCPCTLNTSQVFLVCLSENSNKFNFMIHSTSLLCALKSITCKCLAEPDETAVPPHSGQLRLALGAYFPPHSWGFLPIQISWARSCRIKSCKLIYCGHFISIHKSVCMCVYLCICMEECPAVALRG